MIWTSLSAYAPKTQFQITRLIYRNVSVFVCLLLFLFFILFYLFIHLFIFFIYLFIYFIYFFFLLGSVQREENVLKQSKDVVNVVFVLTCPGNLPYYAIIPPMLVKRCGVM